MPKVDTGQWGSDPVCQMGTDSARGADEVVTYGVNEGVSSSLERINFDFKGPF